MNLLKDMFNDAKIFFSIYILETTENHTNFVNYSGMRHDFLKNLKISKFQKFENSQKKSKIVLYNMKIEPSNK